MHAGCWLWPCSGSSQHIWMGACPMGSTPRQHRYQLPMATRSTDVSMMQQCPGRWLLTNFYEQTQAEASFFILGSALHTAIENAIVFDMDADWAQQGMRANIERELERAAGAERRIESSKRGFDTMIEDAERMLGQWFRTVHPDSSKRLPIYDEYEWPPVTEDQWFYHDGQTKYPQWGSVDAAFLSKAGSHLALVDWKSGTSRQRNSDQLHFYMYGYGGGRAWFHHLDKQQARSIIQHADPYPGDDVVRQRILATEAIKEGILEDGVVQFNEDWYCNYCPVQHHCPVDGDVRNRDQNMIDLTRMLTLARPMETIPEREVA